MDTAIPVDTTNAAAGGGYWRVQFKLCLVCLAIDRTRFAVLPPLRMARRPFPSWNSSIATAHTADSHLRQPDSKPLITDET